MTLSDAVEAFVAQVSRRARTNTLRAYRLDLGHFVAFVTARQDREIGVAEIDAGVVSRFVASRKTLDSAATLERRISTLRQFCAWGRDEYLFDVDPRALPRNHRFVHPTVTARNDDLLKLRGGGNRDDPHRERDDAVIEILIECGLRTSELCALNTDDVLRPERQIRVGGARGQRFLTLSVNALDAISTHLAQRPEVRDAALFVAARGGRISDREVRRIIQRRAKNVGLNPRILRHTFGSSMQEASGRIDVVQESLGHAHYSSATRYFIPKPRGEPEVRDERER
jgi:integrase/recombinase XerC